MRFESTALPNGLTIVGEEREGAVSVGVGFFVRAGARDETPALSGVSHFLEHMMFKGTAKRSAIQLSYDIGRIGAQANAFTSEDATVYYMAVLPEYLANGLEILSDMMSSVLDPGEFEMEKKVILEEIALYDDRPTYHLFQTSMREYFGPHPAGNPVLGTRETITALSREMMWDYFQERYSPENMVLVASGAFRFEELVALAERYCASWERRPVARRERRRHVPSESERTIHRANLQRSHVSLVGAGPSSQEELRYAAGVLACILGDATGSRAYWALVNKGIADAAVIDSDDMDDVGVIYGYASTYPDRLDDVTRILRAIMESPLEFTEGDLARAKTKIATRLVLNGESSLRRLMAVGLNWLSRGEFTPLSDEVARIRQVSRGEIESLLAEYSFSPTTVVKLLPATA